MRRGKNLFLSTICIFVAELSWESNEKYNKIYFIINLKKCHFTHVNVNGFSNIDESTFYGF